ncbi:MAG: hypothetical protein IK100_11820 [Muribaculaceae bacterium]|nr:hypothetical protein [Muribaculaceae bacterium]
MKDNEETKKMELGELDEFSDLDTRFKGWFLCELTTVLCLNDVDAGQLMMAEEFFTSQERDVSLLMIGALGEKVLVRPMGCYTTLNKAIRKVLTAFVNNFTPDEDGSPSVFYDERVGNLKIGFKHEGVKYIFVLAPSYIDCPVVTEEELALALIVSPNEITGTE